MTAEVREALMQVTLDPWTRRLRPTILFGGSPPRFLRLNQAGAIAMDEIELGDARSDAAVQLAERLIDVGMAYRRPPPAARDALRTVSVVIPVYDRAAEACELITSLAGAEPSVGEIIVVDDASPAPSARRLAACVEGTPGVRLIRHEHNLGPAAARNTGADAASCIRVLFIDSDCLVPEPGWIETLLGHLAPPDSDATPPVAAVAPRIVSAGVAHPAGRASMLAQRYDQAFCPLDMGTLPGLVGPNRRVRYVPTAALLVDLELARQAGAPRQSLFDADLRFGEDVDFVWRLVGRGARVVYDPSVQVRHREPATIAGLIRRRFDYGSSAADLDRRHRGATGHLSVSPLAVIATVGALAGQVPVVAASYAAQVAALDSALARASLPNDQLLRAVATSTARSALGIGRYLNQLWWPLVLAALITPRVPRGVQIRLMVLCFGRSVEEVWSREGSLVDRAVLAAARTVDEAAYGAGVWRGALGRRGFNVIKPRLERWIPKLG